VVGGHVERVGIDANAPIVAAKKPHDDQAVLEENPRKRVCVVAIALRRKRQDRTVGTRSFRDESVDNPIAVDGRVSAAVLQLVGDASGLRGASEVNPEFVELLNNSL
jgi:hypothetical protein